MQARKRLKFGVIIALSLFCILPVLLPGETAEEPAKDEKIELSELRLGGVALVRESDRQLLALPFNHEKGYYLSLVGNLSRPVLYLKGGELSKAVADTGLTLQSDDPATWRTIRTGLLRDQRTVQFEIMLRFPDEEVKAIKEVSGNFIAGVAGETKTADLGVMKLETGSEGKALSAHIGEVGADPLQEGYSNLTLKLTPGIEATDRPLVDYIKAVNFLDQDGKPLEITLVTWRQSHPEVSLLFNRAGEFPSQAQVTVELYDKIKEYTIPFKLENFSLLGAPLKTEAATKAETE